MPSARARRRLAGAAMLLALAAGCSSDPDDPTPSATAGPTTTLPPSSTTTTLPPRAVTEVDVCSFLRDEDLEAFLDEPTDGEPGPEGPEDEEEGGVPAFVTGECSWPSADDPQLVLHYLAPTTAADGPQHLEDVLATATGFAEGGRVIPQEVGAEVVGVLLDADEVIREVAVVKRSALIYLIVDQEVSARDGDALVDYATLLATALRRAPR